MNSAIEQARQFIVCVFSGITAGFFYEILSFLFKFALRDKASENSSKSTSKNEIIAKTVVAIKQVIFFVISAFYFKYVTFLYYFPSVRAFMFIGFFIGLFCFSKSLHKAIAIFSDVLYNKLTKLFNAVSVRLKKLFSKLNLIGNRYERRKKTQSSVGGGIGWNNVVIRFSGNRRISNSRHIRKKKQNRYS